MVAIHFSVLLALSSLAAGTNRQSDMQAFIAFGSSDYRLSRRAIPVLGDLHKKFQNLPDSCEVLVRVNSSSVNPADRTTPGPFPQVMGSDMAGVVISREDTCKRLQVGDRVWGDIGAVVQTAESASGKENGAFAEVAVALESQLSIMPKNIDFCEAGSLPKVALTSYKALKWYGGAPYTTAKVLILGGSGGTGSAGIQLAKAFGATEIITTTSSANMDYVRSLGASSVIDYHTSNWWEVLTDGSLDAIYDTVGETGTGDRAMPKLKSGGYYVTIVGDLPKSPRSDVHANMFINSKTNLNNSNLLDDLKDLVELDRLRMRRLRRYALSDIANAFVESSQGHVVGKVVIEMEDSSIDDALSV